MLRMKNVLLCSLMALTLASCGVIKKVAFVPAYNAGVVSDIKLGQQLAEKLYQPENAVYNDSLYVMFAEHIASIRSAELARPSSVKMFGIVSKLQTAFAAHREEHKRKGTATPTDLKLWLLYLRPYWKDLLNSEQSLK